MSNVVSFPRDRRAAQIAADMSHKNGYGLMTTQTFQREAVRRMEREGLTPYMAAHLVVRGPRESIFNNWNGAA